MKKTITIILTLFMVLTMSIGLVSCGEDKVSDENNSASGESKAGESKSASEEGNGKDSNVTLVEKSFDYISFKIPGDFGEFKDSDGGNLATNKDSTASVFDSKNYNSMGRMAADITKDYYTKTFISGYTDVSISELKTVKLTHTDAVYVHFTAKNAGGTEVEVHSYLILIPTDDGDDMFKNILFSFNKTGDSTLKASIEQVKSSVDFNFDIY
jgi:hypothetical protein